MATSIIGGGSAAPTPQEREPVEFFTLNAKYLIDPASNIDDLAFDIECLHETVGELLQRVVEATESDGPLNSLVFGALYLFRQAKSVAAEYCARTGRAAAAAADSATPGISDSSGDISKADRMGDALNEGAYAHHAISASLTAISSEVYERCGSQAQGLFEAAIAGAERLDRAMARGMDAWGAQ